MNVTMEAKTDYRGIYKVLVFFVHYQTRIFAASFLTTKKKQRQRDKKAVMPLCSLFPTRQ